MTDILNMKKGELLKFSPIKRFSLPNSFDVNPMDNCTSCIIKSLRGQYAVMFEHGEDLRTRLHLNDEELKLLYNELVRYGSYPIEKISFVTPIGIKMSRPIVSEK